MSEDNQPQPLYSKEEVKEAYKSGQGSMYCGCYAVADCTSFEEWLEKSKEDE